jgi:AraC family transcriptional regulator
MLLHRFPELNWLKGQIASGQSWTRSVILNVNTSQSWRPGVCGPVSLFVNQQGFSHYTVDHRRTYLGTERYFLTRAGDRYDLEIDNPLGTTVLNIHFAEGFPEAVHAAWTGSSATPLFLFNQSFERTPVFDHLIQELTLRLAEGISALAEEECLTALMLHLLQVHHGLSRDVEQLSVRKQETGQRLYQQLGWSVDYMHTYFAQALRLEDLAQAACLSKYHYLRYFNACFQQTPYQYLTQLRLHQVKALLKTRRSLYDIATITGFESAATLSRSFRQNLGCSPRTYRQQA